jgi:hypothetical protein
MRSDRHGFSRADSMGKEKRALAPEDFSPSFGNDLSLSFS